MSPFFTTVENNLRVMIIPETDANFDGHPIITYTYYIYEDNIIVDDEGRRAKENSLLLVDKNDPSYIGNIVFQKPERVYSYHTGGNIKLSYTQINQIIEKITAYRKQSSMWQI